jgi:hypothetical protein
MENSQAYKDFIKQIEATGRDKMDGYYPLTLENIYEWEREEIEDIIWDYFVNKNDSGLAIFMPKLKKYKGIDALKSKLDTFNIPSGGSVNIAEILYIISNEKKYLNVINQNYTLSANNYEKVSIVARLSRLAKNGDVYSKLVDIYISDIDKTNQLSALCGILWADGYLSDIDNFNEISKKMEFLRMFSVEIAEKRREIIMKYGSGDFEKYKNLN